VFELIVFTVSTPLFYFTGYYGGWRLRVRGRVAQNRPNRHQPTISSRIRSREMYADRSEQVSVGVVTYLHSPLRGNHIITDIF